MTATTLAPPLRRLLETIALAAAVAFLVLVLVPACDYASDERFMMMPGLDISGSWRAAALPVGMGLMVVAALLRLAAVASWRAVLVAAATVGAVIAALWFAQPLPATLGNLNLILFFVVLIAACVFSGVPIAFAFGLATLGYLTLTTTTPLPVMIGRMGEGMPHLILLAVPLFVFLGLLIEVTGMARPADRVPRVVAGARARRPVVRIDRRDVPGLGHLGLQGGGHGRDRARAVPRDAQARRQAGRARRAVVVILSMGIGLFAPPFGVGHCAACAVGKVDPSEGIRPLMGYLGALVVGVIVVAAVPWISTGFLR